MNRNEMRQVLDLLEQKYTDLLHARFKLTGEETQGLEPYDLLCLVGRKRGMLLPGGEVNTERAAITLLDEFRGGKIGRITREEPPRQVKVPVKKEEHL